MHEKPYRSVVKSISWRTLGTLDTMILYYFHERAWNKLSFGRVETVENDYQI